MEHSKKVIWAISDVDAEDIESSIIRTYKTNREAQADLDLLNNNEHPEFFGGGIYEIFSIELP